MLSDDALRGVLGSAGVNELDQLIEQIAVQALDARVDFLFGAGMSVDSGVPAGAALGEGLLRTVLASGSDEAALVELARSTPLELIAEAAEANITTKRQGLAHAVRDILLSTDVSPSQAHRDFAAVARHEGHGLVRRVFTTNFDDLLEQALGDSSHRITPENTREYEDALASEKIPVVYLHGRLDGRFMITESDIYRTRERVAVNLMLQSRLFDSGIFVMVGYSMSDPDLRQIYREFRDQLAIRPEADKQTVVVYPVHSEAQYILHKKIWEARGSRFLPYTAGDFFATLRAQVELAGAKQGTDALRHLYGWTAQELSIKADKLMAALGLDEREDAYQLLRDLAPTRP